MKEKAFKLILITVIILLAAYLRLWGIWNGSFAFTYDVGRDLLAVRDLVYNHKISLIGPTSGQMGIFYGPWWYWLISIPFILFSGNPAGVATFIALTGLGASLIGFIWGRKYFNNAFAFVLFIFIALSPYSISTTSQIWSPNILIILTLTVLAIFFHIDSLSKIQIVLFGFLLMMLLEMEMVFGVFFIIAFLVNLVLWDRKFLFSQKIFFLIAGGLITEAPRIIFDFRHQFLQVKTLMTMIISSPNDKVINFSSRLNYLWEKWETVMPIANFPINLFLSLCILTILVLGYKRLDAKKKNYLLRISTIIVSFVVLTIFYPKDFWDYYLIGLPIFFCITLAYFIYGVSLIAPKKIVFIIVFAYSLLIIKQVDLIERLRNPLFVGNVSLYRNQLAVVDYIYQIADKHNFNYIAYTPPQIEYTWRYLFNWYGKNKYGYEPVIKRQERFYIIIEPDPDYEGRITDWLKIRKDDGIYVSEKTLPGDIIVQTRTRPKI